MVARPKAPYRSANAGELSPDAAGRIDIKPFYSAGLRYKNVEPVAPSGWRRMAGSFDTGPVRPRVATVAFTGQVFTITPFSSGDHTIWQANVTADKKICALHLLVLTASSGSHQARAEALVGATWRVIGGPVTADTNFRDLTLALPPGKFHQATAVRIVGTFSSSATISVSTVQVLEQTATRDAPRYASVRHDDGTRYFFSLQVGMLDIFNDDVFVASCYLPTITAAILPEVNFYTELATVGIFHKNIRSVRVQRSGSSARWVIDYWPYDQVPTADLGSSYTKTNDIWVGTVKWSGTGLLVYVAFTVDGETTEAVPYQTTAGAAIAIDHGTVSLTATADAMRDAIQSLPSLGASGVSVTITANPDKSHKIRIVFSGTLAGREYEVNPMVTNTADAAALGSHVQIGKTDLEPLISGARGYPGVVGLIQDRMAYGDIPAVPPAIAISQVGEYFNLSILASGAGAGRLDKLRGASGERVLWFLESTYFLVGTDRAIYFASNRTINKTDPLNFVPVASFGAVPNCMPAAIDSTVYFIGTNPKEKTPIGSQVMSLAYDDIQTKFEPVPEHLLVTHLVEDIIRLCGQDGGAKNAAARLWMLRRDGRLIIGSVIKSQEVLGYHEWILAEGGKARELHIDVANDVRICVERDGDLRHERLSRETLLQGAVVRQCDLAGTISQLDHLEGLPVWAVTDEGTVGPLTVDAGRISLTNNYAGTVQVGVWAAPLWESMPRWMITPNDEVLERPGRIHTVDVALIASEAIAIGANGQPPINVPLLAATDATDARLPAKSMTASRHGILGLMTGTTVVITQTRPGELHVRDIKIGEKL